MAETITSSEINLTLDNMTVTITSPETTLTLNNMTLKGSFEKLGTVIVTKMNFREGAMVGYVFKDVKFQWGNGSIILNASNCKELSIFVLVDIMYPDWNNLLEIFEKYDGTILALSADPSLTINRENLPDGSSSNTPDVYVVTGY